MKYSNLRKIVIDETKMLFKLVLHFLGGVDVVGIWIFYWIFMWCFSVVLSKYIDGHWFWCFKIH